MALLKLENISKYYGGLAAVVNLDMHVDEGEILGLIGPNGAGKTTTFNVITGEASPTEGRVIFQGRNITGLPPHKAARLGIVRTYQLVTLFKGLTVLENVLIGLHLHARVGFPETILTLPSYRRRELDHFAKAINILEMLELTRYLDERAETLPHGLQRTLGVAIGLAAGPKVLLLDEPLTGMNPQEAMEMIGTIRQIRDRTGTTIVIVEHNMRAVMALCERIVVINFGIKIAEGSPGEIRKEKQVIEAYLGSESNAA